MRTLKRAVEGGFICYDYLEKDPLMASMIDEPAVAGLIELARVKHLAFKEGYQANIRG